MVKLSRIDLYGIVCILLILFVGFVFMIWNLILEFDRMCYFEIYNIDRMVFGMSVLLYD